MVPEEKFDGRCLYDKLKEQRDAKDLEFEESKKFKNLIRGLDDEDVDHLTDVDNRKLLSEKKQKEEELKELQDYRAKVAELQEVLHTDRANGSKPKSSQPSRSSQRSILSTVVKRKAAPSAQEPQQKRSVAISRPSLLKCLAVLPGIGDYKSSDESDESSDALEEANSKTDLKNLIRTKKEQCDE